MKNDVSTTPKKSGVRKTINIIIDILVTIFVIFAIVVTVFAFATQSSPDGVPSIGGTCILTVQSDSMYPTFVRGDIILGTKLTTLEKINLQVGDIISFDAGDLDGDQRRDINSHRIVEIVYTESGAVMGYKTMGDNNGIQDDSYVLCELVICKYSGKRISGIGTFLNYLQQPTGFLICIVLPLLIFFLFEVFCFIKKIIEIKSEGNAELSATEEEIIRQQAVAEYIRQQQEQNQNAAEEPKEDKPSEENTDKTDND